MVKETNIIPAKTIETIFNNIEKNVNYSNYFELNKENKFKNQLIVLKVVKTTVSQSIPKNKVEKVLELCLSISDRNENYELSGLLKDIISNFEKLYPNESTQKSISTKIKTS